MPVKTKRTVCCFLVLAVVWCLYRPMSACAVEDQAQRVENLTSYTMGVLYDLRGETGKAIGELKAIAPTANSPEVFLRLGADYARIGKLDEAEAELNQVLVLDNKNVQARYLLALIYSSRKQYDKAADQYEQILTSFSKEDPANIEVYGYLGQLYYSEKKYSKAITQFEKMLSLDPKNVNVMFLLGSLYLEVHNDQKAIEYFSNAIKINPKCDTCLNSLGYVYAERGIKLDEAEKLVGRALAIAPNNGAYLDSMGWVYYQQGHYKKALEYLKKADHFLTDPVIYNHLGDTYMKLNDKEKAKKYWDLSIKLNPKQKDIIKKLQSL